MHAVMTGVACRPGASWVPGACARHMRRDALCRDHRVWHVNTLSDSRRQCLVSVCSEAALNVGAALSSCKGLRSSTYCSCMLAGLNVALLSYLLQCMSLSTGSKYALRHMYGERMQL